MLSQFTYCCETGLIRMQLYAFPSILTLLKNGNADE